MQENTPYFKYIVILAIITIILFAFSISFAQEKNTDFISKELKIFDVQELQKISPDEKYSDIDILKNRIDYNRQLLKVLTNDLKLPYEKI